MRLGCISSFPVCLVSWLCALRFHGAYHITDSLIIGNRFYGELQRGDIVIFERNGTCLVKRIAAIPGDTVYLDDQTHTVSVNVKTENATRVLEIPEDSYFMLGDNAAVSIDSRYWENPFISKDDVQARVILSE